MTDMLQAKVDALKKQIKNLKGEVDRMEKEDNEGRLSPLERMRMSSLIEEHNELVARLKELAL